MHNSEEYRQFQENLKSVLNTQHGRHVIWHLLEMCNVFSISYTGDVNSTIFNEGTRSAGNRILREINAADETKYLIMQQENIDRKNINKALKEKEDEIKQTNEAI